MRVIRELLKSMDLVWGYVRTSGDLNPADSIFNQIQIIKGFAEESGLRVQGIWSDEKKTGTNTEREGFQNLVKLIKAKKINLLLINYFDRLSREAEVLIKLLVFMKVEGIECIAIAEDKQLSFMSDEEIAIVAINAEEENKARTKRIANAKRQNEIRGEFVRTPPFGYKVDRESGKRPLVVVEEEAKVVKEVFQKYINGMSPKEISQEYRAKKVCNRVWSINVIEKILTEHLYTGEKFRKVQNENGEFYYEQFSKVGHEAIIDKKVFLKTANKVNQEMRTRPKAKYTRLQHTFKNVLYCPECGSMLKAERLSYFCGNKNCEFSRISKNKIESHLLKYVRKLDENTDSISSMKERQLFYTKQLVETETETQKLVKQFAQNMLNENRFKEWLFLLSQRRKEVEKELDFNLSKVEDVPYTDLIEKELFIRLNEQLVKNKVKLTFSLQGNKIVIEELDS